MNRNYSHMQLARHLLELHPQYSDLRGFLHIVDESQKRMADMASWQKETGSVLMFESLPESKPEQSGNEPFLDRRDMEIINAFVSKAYTHHKSPVPSTWEGHVPFLFCLLDFARPRRFVELGSQYGNCFFAACQMSKQLNDSIDCVAIDMWIGDEHAGKYSEDVFRQFSRILHRDYPKGKYIRKFFDEAVTQFADGSIDILHIDGLHTYEAVAHDYQTWLPKLSDRGIILFHDTQVRERGFGVWKLWSELKEKYPSFEFEHSHGLGVLLIGAQAKPSLQRLFQLFEKPEYIQFLRFFFSKIGKLSPIQK